MSFEGREAGSGAGRRDFVASATASAATAPSATRISRWLVPLQAPAAPRLHLFCLPFAGGGASTYRSWGGALPEDVAASAVQLPGREGRFSEPLLTELASVVGGVVEAIRPSLDRPYALFGHSMGAVIAYETARRLRQLGHPEPRLLVVSGRQAPFLPPRERPMHALTDEAFLDGLRRLEGTPAEVLANAELMQLVLPILRADFRVIETYRHQPAPPLATRVLVLGGERDGETDRDALEAWRETTSGGFRCEVLPGGHFFVTAQRDRVLSILREELNALPAEPAALSGRAAR